MESNNKHDARYSSIPSSSPSSLSSFQEIIAKDDDYKTSISNSSFDNNRLTSIDVISVDKQSRVTLTKKAKKIIPLEPGDKITIYQDRYNKNIILQVQKQHPQSQQQQQQQQDQENKNENWILTIKKDKDGFSNKIDQFKKTHYKTENLLRNELQDKSFINKVKENSDNKKNQIESSLDKHNLCHYKQDTLYSTPILLVDDEPDLLSAFSILLKDEGYRNVKSFSNSKNMLKFLFDSPSPLQYKMVILDIRMSDVNGIQLYQILKILNPSVKVIFITALDAVDELISLYPAIKNTDIIRKPFYKDKFIETVNDKVSTLLTL